MKLKIITVPDPILRKKSKPIEKIDRNVQKLSEAMIALIENGPEGKRVGVGLAAVQVGRLWQMFVAFDSETKQHRVFINPKFLGKSKEITNEVIEGENKTEGCLSVPGVTGVVRRHEWVKLRYQDLDGEWKEEKFLGFLSVIIQHECDHLEGILFTNRVLAQNGELYEVEKEHD